MAKKQKSLTEKEKEHQRLLIPFDKSKQFFTNLNTIFEVNEVFQEWEIDFKSLVLKSNTLTLKFKLSDTAIEKVIESLDVGQKKLETFLNPDEVPDEELEAQAN